MVHSSPPDLVRRVQDLGIPAFPVDASTSPDQKGDSCSLRQTLLGCTGGHLHATAAEWYQGWAVALSALKSTPPGTQGGHLLRTGAAVQVDRLRRSIADLDAEVAGLEKLLKQADPDNYYKEGTHAARVAREKGLRLYNQDKEKQAALEKRKRQQAVSRRRKAQIRPHPVSHVSQVPACAVNSWQYSHL